MTVMFIGSVGYKVYEKLPYFVCGALEEVGDLDETFAQKNKVLKVIYSTRYLFQ